MKPVKKRCAATPTPANTYELNRLRETTESEQLIPVAALRHTSPTRPATAPLDHEPETDHQQGFLQLLQEQRATIKNGAIINPRSYLVKNKPQTAFINKSYLSPITASPAKLSPLPPLAIHHNAMFEPSFNSDGGAGDPRVAEISRRAQLLLSTVAATATADDLLRKMTASEGGSDSTGLGGPLGNSGNFGGLVSPRSSPTFGNRSRAVDPTPFMPRIVLLNVGQSSAGTGLTVFKPWKGQACVLMVDISGYSKITAALAWKGAHVLSRIVNAYMTRIIQVISDHRGEVVKFAGDAILAIFASHPTYLHECCLAACACAIALQKRCGEHVIETAADEEPLLFRMHVGVVFGDVEMYVFDNPSCKNMERATHHISGGAIAAMGTVVDHAEAGEVCVSRAVVDMCRQSIGVSVWGDKIQLTSTQGIPNLAGVIDLVGLYDEAANSQDADCEDDDADAFIDMDSVIPSFVHMQILQQLATTANNNDLAEMRFLCVMFIAKSSDESTMSTEDWFFVVQGVLDKHRCPIVKLIDDDKGVHVIAAVNLFQAERYPALVGVEAATNLMHHEVGTRIGIACGPTFCGIIGSDTACRWDITGAACVRACRLMQHAIAHEAEVGGCCIDVSVFDAVRDVSLVAKVDRPISVKGSKEPLAIYQLSRATHREAWKILSSNSYCDVHAAEYAQIADLLQSATSQRSAIILKGPVGVGKAILAVRASCSSDLTPVLHTAVRDAPIFSIAETICAWFKSSANQTVRNCAANAAEAFHDGRTGSTGKLLHELVRLAIAAQYRVSVVVKYADLLDTMSLAFIRQVLVAGATETQPSEDWRETGGRFVFCLTTSATIPHAQVEIPIVTLSVLSNEVARKLIVCRATWRCSEELFAVILQKSSGVPQYIDAIIGCIQRQRPYLTVMGAEGTIHASPEALKLIEGWTWPFIAPQLMPSLLQIVDGCSPVQKRVLHIIAAAQSGMHAVVTLGLVERVAKRSLKKKLEPTLWSSLAEVMQIVAVEPQRYCSPPGMQSIRRDSFQRESSQNKSDLVRFRTYALRDVILASMVPERVVSIKKLIVSELAALVEQVKPWNALFRAEIAKSLETPTLDLAAAVAGRVSCCEMHTAEYDARLLQLTSATSHSCVTPSGGGVMPMDIVFVKNYEPPIALGPIADFAYSFSWRLRCHFLDAVNGNRDQTSTLPVASVKAEIEQYMIAIDKISRIVGESGPFHKSVRLREQRDLEKWLTFTADVAEAQQNAVAFLSYTSDILSRRAVIATERAWKLRARILPPPPEAGLPADDTSKKAARTAAAVHRAIYALKLADEGLDHIYANGVENFRDILSAPERQQLDGGFHQAIIQLAIYEFASPHPKMSLERIRDAVLQRETETYASFGAFVLFHHMLLQQE